MKFVDAWRRKKCALFDLTTNSTARRTVSFDLWGRPVRAYANANLSIYSVQPCNAACPFCVEQLRPASRGMDLVTQKRCEEDDGRYFGRLEESLHALSPLSPSVSITGGEPTKDPRLLRVLRLIDRCAMRKRTLTTNGSGLLDYCGDYRVIDAILDAGCQHLNISVAHSDLHRSAKLMRLGSALGTHELAEVARLARDAGCRVRLSCVLLRSGVAMLEDICAYLHFAQGLGIDNVIFRQLMRTDVRTHAPGKAVDCAAAERVMLEPLLDQISDDREFTFHRQILGYYYYVEVWRYHGMDVVFEEADLAQLEAAKRRDPVTIHELVFHPDSTLASTWQPWDGVLGPPSRSTAVAPSL